MKLALVAGLAAAALAGCSTGGDDEPTRTQRANPPADTRPRAGEPREARAIREWSAALNARRYEKAASFFAAGAVVEQAREFRLPDREAAIAFNRSLPCEADVTDVDDEGATVLAAFRLRGGAAGGCDGGTARVRFRFHDGKFTEWRQLPEPEAPPGQVI